MLTRCSLKPFEQHVITLLGFQENLATIEDMFVKRSMPNWDSHIALSKLCRISR